MAQVEIRIYRKGREIAKVTRPLRYINGKPFIKYKKQFRPLINGSEVWIDDIAPLNQERKSDVPQPRWTEHKTPNQSLTGSAEEIEWDESQRFVIQSPPEDRLLISAGPGTGKTAVACARVAQLVNESGLEPSRIWLISFTRTAVHEIRNRIATYLKDATSAFSIKIATLDSHAWTIHSGFDDNARVLGSYEENIERVLELVRTDDDVADYLFDNVEHLVVDEAQDIVGTRAELVIDFIRRISTSCGVTMFADEAQAIYGFADDTEIRLGESTETTLPEKIRAHALTAFQTCELTKVHRTHSSQLLRIFSDIRRKVLVSAGETENKLEGVKDEVVSLSHGEAPKVGDDFPTELDDTFILYRRRCDVLLTSSMMVMYGIPHRVRMSGLPVCIQPWIGTMLSEHTNVYLTKDEFMKLWDHRVRGTAVAVHQAEEAWDRLIRIAGRTDALVDMRSLRQRLGRAQPPPELCEPEFGLHGPIVGTIHASKGRETETVHLMLSDSVSKEIDEDEETRVVFVGATRGRSRLLTGRGWRQPARNVEVSGRAYRLQTTRNQPFAQFEIGRDSDIHAEGLTGREFFKDATAVKAAQNRILGFADESVTLVAESDRNTKFAYRMKEDGKDDCLAVLSQKVNTDLFTIGNGIQEKLRGGRRRPPPKIPHLHVRGVRTVVVPPETPEVEKLHEPWRSSGIMLAPLVLAYTKAYFPRFAQRTE